MEKPAKYFIILASICVLARVIFWFSYEPTTYPDTRSYLNLAKQMQEGDFSTYDGRRTPVYPLILIMCRFSYQAIWVLQSVLGVAISLMLFRMAWYETGKALLSMLVGLSYTLSLNQIFFEANIVTETLTTFLIVLTLLLLQQSIADKKSVAFIGAIGITAAMAGLTRPLFLVLAPLCLVFLAVQKAYKRKALVVFIAPIVVMTLSWCVFNKVVLDYFGPTTLTGYNLTQHSGAFIERAPDRYAQIRDLYLKFRDQRLKETGTHSMTIWRAAPEIQQATGLSFGELSKQLTEMSLSLFARHPMLYFRGVAKAWLGFWSSPNYWKKDKVRPQGLSQILGGIWWTERRILVAINAMFIILALYSVYHVLVHKRNNGSGFRFLIIAVIMSASVVQGLMEYGENGRYSLPVQPLILYVFITSLWCYLRRPQAE